MLKKRVTLLLIAFVIILLCLPVSKSIASCGSANCFLVTGTQEGIALPGQIIVDLSYRFIPMDQVHKGSKSASEAIVPAINFADGVIEPDHHSEIRTNNELAQLDINYGITTKFAMSMAIPFMNNRRHEHIDEGVFSNTDGTTGFGDLRLTGRYALLIGTKNLLVGSLGIKAPTGEYKLLDSGGAINEPTIQPGTGSWDGIVSAYYTYQIIIHKLGTFFSGSYQINTENSLDYKFGNTMILSAGISHTSEKITSSLQINLRQSPHDKFKGEEVSSTGGKWVYITPGIRIQAALNTSLYAHIQLPVYQSVNEVNLVPRYGLIFGVSHAF